MQSDVSATGLNNKIYRKRGTAEAEAGFQDLDLD